MTIIMIVGTIVASTLVSIVVSNITTTMYMLQRKIISLDRFVQRLEERIYTLESDASRRHNVKPKKKKDEK